MAHFETYGKMAKAEVDTIIQNGRYYAQADAEQYIPQDVISKLALKPDDSVLDVGCGMGLNLREIVKLCPDSYACDHENVIARLQKQPDFSDVTFYGGNFLNLDIERKFSKVLVYGVVPALPDEEVLYAFIDKAVSLMQDDGMTLIGDVSNVDKKKRFLASKNGQAFQQEWEQKCKLLDDKNPTKNFISAEDSAAVTITDDMVFDILKKYRKEGYHSYLMQQPQNLPFGCTREDILIVGPEYKDHA